MQKIREEISSLATPIIVLECREQDLQPLTLGKLNNRKRVVRVLRGNKSHTKRDFFDEAAAALQFPYYFGENWDAFNECINDLSWLPADSYLLIIVNVEQLLSEESSKEFEIFMEIMERAAQKWRSGFNHARLMHATDEKGGTEKVEFAVALQHRPDANLTGPFGDWLNKADVPTVKTD